jgi:uncharacterized protein (DUF58 family)
MLTRAGRNTLLASAVLYGAAFTLGYSGLAVPAAAGVLALAVAVVSVARRPQLQVALTVTPARVSRGQQITAAVSLRNDSQSRSPRFLLSLPHGTGRAQAVVKPLAGKHGCEIPLALPCVRRGLTEVGPLTVRRSDVFGLCLRVQNVADPVTVCVYPAVHPVQLPSAPRLRQLEGITYPYAPAGGIAFHSLREYMPGDDLRYVHWRASAKTASNSGNLLVRQHADPGDASSAVLLDTCAGSYLGSPELAGDCFEEAVDLAASVLVASARHGFRVRLHTSGGMKVLSGAGRDSTQRVLDALARVAASDREFGPVVTALASSRGTAGARTGTLTLITGDGSVIPGPALQRLRRWHDRVIIARIGGPAGIRSPGAGEQDAGIPEAGTPEAGAAVTRTRVHAFRAAAAAEAAGKWAAIVAPGSARRW